MPHCKDALDFRFRSLISAATWPGRFFQTWMHLRPLDGFLRRTTGGDITDQKLRDSPDECFVVDVCSGRELFK